MSRKRSISSDISTDPKLAAVAEEWGPLPLLLYTWAIPHASDYGQIAAEPTQFRLLVCPALPVKSPEVACAIQQLCAAGLWTRQEKDGREYLQFPEDAWFRHQSYINVNKRPNAAKDAGPAAVQQETPRNAKKQQRTAQNPVSPSPSPTPSEEAPLPPTGGTEAGAFEGDEQERPLSPKPSKKAMPRFNPKAFEAAYDLYPKHEDRLDAVKAWDSERPDDDTVNRILAFIPAAMKTDRWRKNKMPAFGPFLRGQRWEDDLGSYSESPSVPERRAAVRTFVIPGAAR